MLLQPRTAVRFMHTSVSLSLIASAVFFLTNMFFAEFHNHEDKLLRNYFENKPKFFSVWVAVTQIMYFGIYSLLDAISVYGSKSVKALKIRNFLNTLANYIFFSLVFPLSMVLLILFWGFLWWDRELFYPKRIDVLFPPIPVYIMHSFGTPISIIYMFTDIRHKPPKSKTSICLIFFMTIYSFVFFNAHKRTGSWIYPILDSFSSTQVTCILSFTLMATCISFFTGYYVYNKTKELRLYLRTESTKPKRS